MANTTAKKNSPSKSTSRNAATPKNTAGKAPRTTASRKAAGRAAVRTSTPRTARTTTSSTTPRTTTPRTTTPRPQPTTVEQARTPLLVAIGAGDYALDTVRGAAEQTRERISSIPGDLAEFSRRLTPGELRRTTGSYVQAAADTYVSLAERGLDAVTRVRHTPQVEQVFERAEDARDDARELTDEVLGTVARQTRSIGERAARATERITGRVTSTTARIGEQAAEAGDELARDLRSTSRRAANVADAQGTPANARTEVTQRARAARKQTARRVEDVQDQISDTADTVADALAHTLADTLDTAAQAQDQATRVTSGT